MARIFIFASIVSLAIASAAHAQVGDQIMQNPAAAATAPSSNAPTSQAVQQPGATGFLTNPADPTCSIALGCDPLSVPTASLPGGSGLSSTPGGSSTASATSASRTTGTASGATPSVSAQGAAPCPPTIPTTTGSSSSTSLFATPSFG